MLAAIEMAITLIGNKKTLIHKNWIHVSYVFLLFIRIMRHTPRKRFGQNFLVDSQVISDIARAIHPAEDDLLVEIGPGLGALTQPLLRLLKHLYVNRN